MQAIAREFNQSETAFILAPERPGATVRLRSFTPIGAEVFGAGHNALGCWLWLALAGLLPPETIEPGGAADGPAPAPAGAGEASGIQPGGAARPGAARPAWPSRSATTCCPSGSAARRTALSSCRWASHRPSSGTSSPSAARSPTPWGWRRATWWRMTPPRSSPPARAISWSRCATGRPSTGPCRTRYRSPRRWPWPAARAAISTRASGRPADDAAAYARFFNPAMGIAEDPATGTAAGPLAALLVRRGQLEAGPAVIEQGHALGRPSRIQVRVSGPSVTVSGSGLISAEGFLIRRL